MSNSQPVERNGGPPVPATVAESGLDAYGTTGRPDWLEVDWPARQRMLDVEGMPVNVMETGQGPPLLLIHGWSGVWQHWLENIGHFAASHRVIAPDLPGFGLSPMPDQPLSIPNYASAVARLMDALEIERASVIGSSMGGLIGAQLAIEQPQRVERLALVGAAGLAGRYIGMPAGFLRHPLVHPPARLLLRESPLPRLLARRIVSRPRLRRAALFWVVRYPERLSGAIAYELVRGAGRPGTAAAGIAVLTHDVRVRLGDIACPTVVAWGDRDLTVTPDGAEVYAETIPGSRRLVFSDTGHLPMIERPARFNAEMDAFLAEPADARQPAARKPVAR
jgi:pimeloyl-ACP methyl ester carboxylesterase